MQDKELISLDNDLNFNEKTLKLPDQNSKTLSPKNKNQKNSNQLMMEEENIEKNSEETNSHLYINSKILSLDSETQSPLLKRASKYLKWKSKNLDSIHSLLTLSHQENELSRSLKQERLTEISKSQNLFEMSQNFEKVSFFSSYFPLGNCDKILRKLNNQNQIHQSKTGRSQIYRTKTMPKYLSSIKRKTKYSTQNIK